MGKYQHLLSPIEINGVRLRNRIVKAPQGSRTFSAGDHVVTRESIGLYEEIAAGGAAMVVIGATLYVEAAPLNRHCGLYNDSQIEGMTKLVEAVHSHGALIVPQLWHGGPVEKLADGFAIAASGLSGDELPYDAGIPTRAMEIAEIEQFEEAMVSTSLRAKRAGCDGVEVHAGNGYLLASFASPIWNRRTDRYGCGSPEDMTRFACETVQKIKAACGNDFIVGVRMSGQEIGDPRGLTCELAAKQARCYENAGADYVSVTAYVYGLAYPEKKSHAWRRAIESDPLAAHVPTQYPCDYFAYPQADPETADVARNFKTGIVVPMAAQIKKDLSIPVIVNGRLNEDLGEAALESGAADIIAFGRPLWADPEMPNKLIEGRYEDRRHCNHCATCEGYGLGERVCRMNPTAFGKAYEFNSASAEKRKKVAVIGGGPAGMEAAIWLDKRGHDVVLFDQHAKLGGKLPLANMLKGSEFDESYRLLDYLTAQMAKSSVDVRLNTRVDINTIASVSPDAVVLATGGLYQTPEDLPIRVGDTIQNADDLSKLADLPLRILGANRLHAISKKILPFVGRRVVIIGGQIEALQGAIFMAKRGREVLVVCSEEETGKGMPPRYLRRCYPWFDAHGIKIETGVSFDEISKKSVAFTDHEGKRQQVACDTVMVLLSQVENNHLLKQCQERFGDVYRIGAANGASSSLMVDAMREGRRIGGEL